jgi:hypothetical protein
MTQWIIVEDITVNSFGVKHLPEFRTFKTSEEAYDYCEESLIPEMIDELHEWVGDDTIFDLQDDHIDRKYWYSYIDYLGNRIQGEIRVQPIQVEGPD